MDNDMNGFNGQNNGNVQSNNQNFISVVQDAVAGGNEFYTK